MKTAILIAGDFCPQKRVAQCLEDNNFGEVFGGVKKYTEESDYSILNLEAPIVINRSSPIRKTGPHLQCTVKTIEAIKYAGFKGVTLANNHFYDYGESGVKDTLRMCSKENIDTVGGGYDIKDAIKILYKELSGKRFAFVNFCENEWSVASTTKGGSAPLNPVDNYYQIKEAVSNADYVIVITHGGTEHYNLPTPRMKKTYRYFIDCGADVVVNHHQHCYSGYEKYNGKYIFYGLGNFCFDIGKQQRNFWNEGYMLRLQFDDSIHFELIPYVQCAETSAINFDVNPNILFANMNELNKIIANDSLLEKQFIKMADDKANALFLSLEPYGSKYLKYLRYKRLIPSLMSKQWYRLLLALFRCESHRDILFNILMKKNNQ